MNATTNNTTNTAHLDSLVRELSAFTSWNELVSSMKSRGYVPTLYPTNDNARELRAEIERAGYRVFPFSKPRPRPGRPIEIVAPVVVNEPCKCHRPELAAPAVVETEPLETPEPEVKVHLTYAQMAIAEDFLFESVGHEITSSAKTFIVAPRAVWEEVLSVAGEMDFEMINGFGGLDLDTPAKFDFAVRAFDRMQASLCERIARALKA